MTTRWPLLVDWLLTTLPGLPGWDAVDIYDTNPITGTNSAAYAIVGHTGEDTGSGDYLRQIDPSTLVDEAGTVRMLLVFRAANFDAAAVRAAGFTLMDAFEDAITTDQTAGGALSTVGTISLAVDVQSGSTDQGVAQSLVISVNYSSLT